MYTPIAVGFSDRIIVVVGHVDHQFVQLLVADPLLDHPPILVAAAGENESDRVMTTCAPTIKLGIVN